MLSHSDLVFPLVDSDSYFSRSLISPFLFHPLLSFPPYFIRLFDIPACFLQLFLGRKAFIPFSFSTFT